MNEGRYNRSPKIDKTVLAGLPRQAFCEYYTTFVPAGSLLYRPSLAERFIGKQFRQTADLL